MGPEDFRARFAELLDSSSVLYNPVSLVESKWAILNKARNEPSKQGPLLEAYRTGLKILETDGRLRATRLTSDSVEAVADELLVSGVKDHFDKLIYGTAADLECILLTEDHELATVRPREGPRPLKVLSWKDVLQHERDQAKEPR